MMNASFSAALALQGRVLWALCLREIHGKHGKAKLGYLWQLIKTAFGIAVFWWIRSVSGFGSPQGLPIPLFLLLGFIPWYIFDGGVRMVMEAVKTNKALLTFPQIFPLDLYCSSMLVIWVTEFVIFLIYITIISVAGYQFQLYDPVSLFFALIGLGLYSFGLGLILSAVAIYIPVIEKLVPMVFRILFFTSGIFYSPSQIAGQYGELIYLNPLVNFIELGRGAFVTRSPSGDVRILYIVVVTCVCLALGLLLERHVRSKQV